MAIFIPSPNYIEKYTKYSFFDPQIYELTLKNKNVSKEDIKLIKDSKYYLDIITENDYKYLDFLKKDNKFKKLMKRIIIKVLEGKVKELKNIKMEDSSIIKNRIVYYNIVDLDVDKNKYGNIHFDYISHDAESSLLVYFVITSYFLEFVLKFTDVDTNGYMYLNIFEIEKYKIYKIEISTYCLIKAQNNALFDYFAARYSLSTFLRNGF